MSNKISITAVVVAILAVVLAGVALVGVNNQSDVSLGASTPGTRFPHGITIGLPASSPTNLALVLSGTCVGIVGAGSNGNVNASTTGTFDCVIPGIIPGDTVDFSFATSTASSPQWGATSSNWEVQGGTASSTSGFGTVRVVNQTGGNASMSASGLASSTSYQVFRSQ